MKNWNLLAEFLGFLSGVLLLLPALALNTHLRKIGTTLDAFKGAVTSFGKEVGEVAKPALSEHKVPKWSRCDELMLQGGAGFLLASFVIKFFVVWTSP